MIFFNLFTIFTILFFTDLSAEPPEDETFRRLQIELQIQRLENEKLKMDLRKFGGDDVDDRDDDEDVFEVQDFPKFSGFHEASSFLKFSSFQEPLSLSEVSEASNVQESPAKEDRNEHIAKENEDHLKTLQEAKQKLATMKKFGGSDEDELTSEHEDEGEETEIENFKETSAIKLNSYDELESAFENCKKSPTQDISGSDSDETTSDDEMDEIILAQAMQIAQQQLMNAQQPQNPVKEELRWKPISTLAAEETESSESENDEIAEKLVEIQKQKAANDDDWDIPCISEVSMKKKSSEDLKDSPKFKKFISQL